MHHLLGRFTHEFGAHVVQVIDISGDKVLDNSLPALDNFRLTNFLLRDVAVTIKVTARDALQFTRRQGIFL